MKKIITYRLFATGVWGYAFYHPNRTKIGSARAVVSPAAPVRIESERLNWYSRFDIDTQIVPGTSRKVMDNRTGEEIYRIVFWQPGLYQVRAVDGRSILVEIREDVYLFGEPMMPVTAMTERIIEADRIPGMNDEAKPCFRTTVFERVNEEYLMMVLSFPALRMC